ncbi:MAG: hypothetical protein K9L64_06000, partial [Candidatus Izimaplasma sp.]|nr:hypothetical protein [Candidatus Izimaplasma bacterium]
MQKILKKNLMLVFLLSLVWFGSYSVSATDFEDSIAGIGVITSDFSSIDGHIDLLVPLSDFENEINSNINPDFINNYPNYENFDYLYDTEWVSYFAFIEDAHCNSLPNQNVYEFATRKDEYLRLDQIKFIHVDSEGNTISVSDIYVVPNPLFFQDFNNIIYYNKVTADFNGDMSLNLDGVFVVVFLITLFIAVSLAGYRFIIAKIMKLKIITDGWGLLYYILIYALMLVVGFLLINQVSFIQRLVPNVGSLIIYAGLLSLFEIVLSYYLVFK